MSRHKTEHPTCTAHLKDGSRCRTYAEDERGLCRYHSEKAEEEVPTPVEPEAIDVPLADPKTEPAKPSSRPQDVRSQLAEDAAEEYGVLRDALLEALKATRETYVTCSNCRHKTQVSLPDWSARVRAVETLLNQGYGRPPRPPNSPHLMGSRTRR